MDTHGTPLPSDVIPNPFYDAHLREHLKPYTVKHVDGPSLQDFFAAIDWTRKDIEHYNTSSLRRFIATVDILAAGRPDRRSRVLELAAAPWGLTLLLLKRMFDRVETSIYGDDSNCGADYQTSFRCRRDDVEYTIAGTSFNIEKHRFPYDNGRFDLVIACEVIEHLFMDPLFTFFEVNRILAPGGAFFISTPNINSVSNLIRMLNGYTPGISPEFKPTCSEDPLVRIYARHNREFTPLEIRVLAAIAGFDVDYVTTENIYDFPVQPDLQLTGSQVLGLRHYCDHHPQDCRDTIFARLVKAREPDRADRYPVRLSLYS